MLLRRFKGESNKLKSHTLFLMYLVLVCISGCVKFKPRQLSNEQRELLEEQAIARWKKAQQQMVQDGYGKNEADGELVWKKKVKKEKFKILNRKKLKKSE